jgi:hypothetical protein
MWKLTLAIFFFSLASPTWATTYYLATAAGGGNDSNSGLSSSAPWLTPNHAVKCGDVILAAPSTAYLAANFSGGQWGTVSCPGGNNVAWLKCATFDTCKISVSGGGATANGMLVAASYWGVQGWEVTTSSTSGSCFQAYPLNGTEIHHIIFANDIANGCGNMGFGEAPNGSAGVDYLVVVGSIAYNGVQNRTYCQSGVDIFEPIASDSLPGTHNYIAGNFLYNNVNGNPCASKPSTDGEGVILDTFSFGSYAGQTVVDNNIAVYNGGRGILAYSNTSAPIYIRKNTVYGNNTQTGQSNLGNCGEIDLNVTVGTQAFLNIAQTNARVAGCNSNITYAYWVTSGDGSDVVHQNYGYDAFGNNDGSSNSPGFSYDPSNLFGPNPSFTNATVPGAPSCGSFASVPACMATVIANFTPTTAAAKAYGYQVPVTTSIYDNLFPQWLCNVNLPAGLVTMGCLAASSLPATVTITSVNIN